MKIKIAGYRMPMIHLPVISTGESHEEHRSAEHRSGEHHRHYDHHYEDVMHGVMRTTRNMPDTWHQHLDKKGGMMSIVEMEYKELMAEKAAGSHDGIEEELEDLAAACICALLKIKSM